MSSQEVKNKPHPSPPQRGGKVQKITFSTNNRGFNIFFVKFIFNFFVFQYSLFQKPSPNALSLPNGERRGGV
jgi:hypothetical protein